MRLLCIFGSLCAATIGAASGFGTNQGSLPNIFVVMVDDMGWNQLGYHANEVGNNEIHTPSIDSHAGQGIKMNRAYFTPWCGPSRAAFQTGTLAAFNENVTQGSWSYDADIGFIGGLPPTLQTIPKALKSYAKSIGQDYATSYAGKWGLQGATWTNTPMGAGYDESRAFNEHSMDGCDGMVGIGARGPPGNGGGAIERSLPVYWDQGNITESDMCEFFESQPAMTEEEKHVACHSSPRVLPKLVDEDLLDFTKERIREHNFDEKPLYHMHALQLMHTPLTYPARYNKDHPNVTLPEYFQEGKVKPPPTNDDMRLTTANAMRYVDDVFNEIMQEIKNAGQWENSIVLFTSDNGGAIFPLNINNNYPLRGGKRSIFEGGYRIAQFLTGGWIPEEARGSTSDTFVFVHDWAPTFLGMAGGSKAVEHLELDSSGAGPAMKGNAMWEYIENSVNNKAPKQKPRKVSFNKDLFYDVEEDSTYKMMHTPEDLSVFFIRKWEPIWPRGQQVIPDFGYISVQPCRPGGKAQSCCYFDVTTDEGEDNPLPVSETACGDLHQEALDLYLDSVTGLCEKFPTIGCFLPNNQPSNKAVDQQQYSLWTHYGAAGPWVSYNKDTGESTPIEAVTHRCACETIDPEILPGEVDAYIPTFQSPSICINKEKSRLLSGDAYPLEYAVDCSGFERTPEARGLDEYGYQGVDQDAMNKIANYERQGLVGGVSLNITMDFYRAVNSYSNREGFTEWPALSKWPYITPRWNTCQQKKSTPVPVSIYDVTPWILSSGDGGSKFANLNMCQLWNDTHSWCIASKNPLQKNITELDPYGNWVKLEDGTVVTPILRDSCENECAKQPHNTAFIGNCLYGMATEDCLKSEVVANLRGADLPAVSNI